MNQDDKVRTALAEVARQESLLTELERDVVAAEVRLDAAKKEAIRVLKAVSQSQVLFQGKVYRLETAPKAVTGEEPEEETLGISEFRGLVLGSEGHSPCKPARKTSQSGG